MRSFKPALQTSLLPGTHPDKCLLRTPSSSPPVTRTCGAHQVETDDHIDDVARCDDYDAPVAVGHNVTDRDSVQNALVATESVPVLLMPSSQVQSEQMKLQPIHLADQPSDIASPRHQH